MSFLLSWLFGGGDAHIDTPVVSEETIAEATTRDTAQDLGDYNSLCLTSARGAGFSGEDNTFAPSVRSINSGRRIQSSTRSSFRVLKVGKVLDRQHFQTFRQTFYNRPSGTFCFSRFIYSIRHLLI